MANNRLYIVDTVSKEYLCIAKGDGTGWNTGNINLYKNFIEDRLDENDENSNLIIGHENNINFYNKWIKEGINYNKSNNWKYNGDLINTHIVETRVYKGIVKEDEYVNNIEALFIGKKESPIAEIFSDDFYNKRVTVRYWVSDKEKTKDELQQGFLKKLFGSVDAEYSENYSEITGYLWTDEKLKIGGHDLLKEIRNYKGMYIYIEVDIY